MKLTLFFIAITTLICACTNNSETHLDALLASGVPKDLAVYRKQQISNVHYNLSFNIPLEEEGDIPAALDLDLDIHDLQRPLILDFNENLESLKSISVNEQEISIQYKNEHLVVPSEYLAIGNNNLKIIFLAGELSLNRNKDYLYTLLVPDRARTLFPCFDQPDIKAVYTLNITAPKEWKVLAGAPLEFTKDQGDFVQHQFVKTDVMSTYLFSFIAGKFEIAESDSQAFKINMLYRETNEQKIQASVDPIFNLHQLSLDFLEDYTDYNFPFQKLDIGAIPGFQYGGMEHVGAVQYREAALFLDNSATQNQELSRAKLIAHETSHMWFGNLVTMKWFDDVWLKEVFANFMADKIINPAFATVNHDLQFLTGHYPLAYETDRTRGTNPIRQNLDNLKDAGSLYGNIIYHKAPIMMRQLEATLGKEKLQEGMAAYINTYANRNADWNDLVKILDAKTDLDLNSWSSIWVNASGRPIIYANISYDDNQIKSFEISQRAEDGSDKVWPQIFEVALVYADTISILSVNLNDRKIEIPSAIGLTKPEAIIYNSNGYGFGIFPINLDQLDHIPQIKDDVARAQSYINSYENTLSGKISPLKAFEHYQNALRTESNELILRLISGQIRSVYWDYLTEEQRIGYQAYLEALLMDKLLGELPPNIKKTLFNLYQSIAYSDVGVEKLYGIWNKDINIPNLILNEDDLTSLAILLSIYKHSKAHEILEKAKTEIKNPDKVKRFAFILPALSQDDGIRSAFFESFKEEKNREKESWVLAACSYIHHPLRQESALENLEISLELLETIQQTGDIFFPKRWLDNTIGRHTSKEASIILDNFISTHPDLNPNLMKKLLQATDNLYRVQKLNIHAEIMLP